MFNKPINCTPCPDFALHTSDGEEVGRICCQPDVDFTLNSYGWPLNDISALNGCKSLQEYEVIAARLREYQAVNPDTSKLSTQELIASIEPHSFQTPAEVARFAEYYGRHLQTVVDARVEQARVEQARAAAAKKATESVPSVAPAVTTTT